MLKFDGCENGASLWVETYFHDCVYTAKDYAGFALGLTSIFVWLTAQLPQFISNIKNQSSEALSIWFLVEWFAGDTLNLLGCLIQGQQLPTTTILAAYFVLVDVLMLTQYIYYGALQARRARLRAKARSKRHHHHHHHHHHRSDGHGSHQVHSQSIDVHGHAGDGCSAASTNLDSEFTPTPGAHGSATPVGSNMRKVAAALAAGASVACLTAASFGPDALGLGGDRQSMGRRLLQHTEPGHLLSGLHRSGAAGEGMLLDGKTVTGGHGCSFLNCDIALLAGTAMGYLSTACYLLSRMSQIRKNSERHSAEGLSSFMFMLTMTANSFTGVSIVLRLRSLTQLKEQLPWMAGTFGTIALDMKLLHQVLTLGARKHGSAALAPSGSHGATHGSAHAAEHGRHAARAHGSPAVDSDAASGGKRSDLEAPLLAHSGEGASTMDAE